MALVELGKQLAQQALSDAITGKDKEKEAPAASPAVAPAGLVIFGQIQGMQKALKEDEELVVLFQSGVERIRLIEIFLPSPAVAVLTGHDTSRNLTRVICPVDSLQLLCKTMKAAPGAKPLRVNLVIPKAKDSSGS
jgi:hypothetical protein